METTKNWIVMFAALWTKRLISRQPFWGGVLRCPCCDNRIIPTTVPYWVMWRLSGRQCGDDTHKSRSVIKFPHDRCRLSLFADGCRPRVFPWLVSLFFFRVGEHRCSGEISWVKHVCCACFMIFFFFFHLNACFHVVCLFSASWADLSGTSRYRHRCRAAKCDKHREIVGQRFFFIPHESESHRESHSILARIGRPDISGQWTNLHHRSQNGPEHVTNDYLVWSLTFIIHVNTNSIVMWETLPNSADWDCFKTPILQGILRTRNQYFRWNIVYFRKPHVRANQLDVQETNFSFAQLNRIRNRILGCRFKDGRDTRAWLVGADRYCSSRKHESELTSTGKLVYISNAKENSWKDWWFG